MQEERNQAVRHTAEQWRSVFDSLEQQLAQSEGHTLAESHSRQTPLSWSEDVKTARVSLADEIALRAYG